MVAVTRFSDQHSAKPRRQTRRRDQPKVARSVGRDRVETSGRDGDATQEAVRLPLRWLSFGWLIFVTAVVAFQPVATADFWWELSRGRAWFDGFWATSRLLLAQEAYADADWLGPSLLYLPYGLMGLWGIPLMRVFAVVGTAWASSMMTHGVGPVRRALFVSALLITAMPAFDPGPLLWDFCALLTLAWIVHRSRSVDGCLGHSHSGREPRSTVDGGPETAAEALGSYRERLALVAAAIGCLLVWANTAPRVILGVIVLCLLAVRIVGPQVAEAVRRRAWRGAAKHLGMIGVPILLAIVATSLTPRGPATLRDSFRLSFPAWSAADGGLEQGPWAAVFPFTSGTSGATAVASVQAWGWLALAWLLIEAWSRRGASFSSAWLVLSGWVVVQLIAWQCVGNLALTGPLLLIVFGFSEPDRSRSAEAVPVTERPPSGLGHPLTNGRKAVLAANFLILAIAVSGLIRRPDGLGLGFGFVERLDVRFLERAIDGKRLEGVVFADNLTTAGMAAWAGGGLQVWDSPQRAQVGGRLREYRLLTADLDHARRAAYRRSDGSEGGWWLPLSRSNTRLLLVDAGRTQLFRSLANSIWRPLAIDGPVIPLARAGDPAFNDEIVLAMRMQDFVDSGRWEYQPPGSTASLFDRDGFGLRGAPIDLSVAYRQAELFRSLGLPRAALSVLRHLRHEAPSDRLAIAIALCHGDLLEWEIQQAGRPSDFRVAVWRQLRRALPAALRSDDPDVPTAWDHGDAIDRRLESAATRYVADDFAGAVAELADRQQSQYRYARAVIWLESGASERAEIELNRLAAEPTDETTAILARSVLKAILDSRAAG